MSHMYNLCRRLLLPNGRRHHGPFAQQLRLCELVPGTAEAPSVRKFFDDDLMIGRSGDPLVIISAASRTGGRSFKLNTLNPKPQEAPKP